MPQQPALPWCLSFHHELAMAQRSSVYHLWLIFSWELLLPSVSGAQSPNDILSFQHILPNGSES